jgi:hypothetical protein
MAHIWPFALLLGPSTTKATPARALPENGVLLKVADPVIRRVTTRPQPGQPGNRCGYGAALPLHDGWVPSRSVRPQRFQAAAPGLVDSCAAHYPQR